MIKLTDDQIVIMGKPNFSCAKPAKVLIASGLYEDKVKKVEYEQAVFIHWALDLYEKHGAEWMDNGNKILMDLLDVLCAEVNLEKGNVIKNKETGKIQVIKDPRKLTNDEEFISENPHENDDFSYLCGREHCRCSQ